MQTGNVVNALLYSCWALSLVGGINFFTSQSSKDKSTRRIVMIMAVAASAWSLFSGALGFSEMNEMADGCFALKSIAFDFYALSFSLFVALFVAIDKKIFRLYMTVGTILSVLDAVIYAFGDFRTYIRENGRTAYYMHYTWRVGFHFVYVILMFVLLLWMAYSFAIKSNLKRKKVFVAQAAAMNIGLFVCAFPDTVFPLWGVKSFPLSGFEIMFVFVGIILVAQKNNAFSISQRNLTDAIYNESDIGVLVLDTEGKITDTNNFAIKLLKLGNDTQYKLDEVIIASDEQIERIVAGKEIFNHLKATNTDIPLSVRSVVYKDKYGDPYGTAVMLLDATAEERVNQQLMEIKVAIEKREGIEKMSHQLVDALSRSIDAKDEYTNGHSHRVAQYSVMIAKKMGYDEDQVRQMEYSALLHDVGKIGVPNAIINKPGKLTDEEYDIIKKHPSIGDNILKDIMEIPQIRIGARWHHERVDGRGYPDGLKGNDIPELARIIAMADAYDAMTSNRSYRRYLPQDVVRAEIQKNRGLQFDERIADIMLEIMDDDVQYELHEPEKNA